MIPPSPYQCCSLFWEVLYYNHTTFDGGRGYFVEKSKCSEGVIIMAEKRPFRVKVSTTFDTYCLLAKEYPSLNLNSGISDDGSTLYDLPSCLLHTTDRSCRMPECHWSYISLDDLPGHNFSSPIWNHNPLQCGSA